MNIGQMEMQQKGTNSTCSRPVQINGSEDASGDADTKNSSDSSNLWPYINKYFQCVGSSNSNNGSVAFQCKLCLPRIKQYSANGRSLFNLKKHISKKHNHKYKEFEKYIKDGMGKCRKRSTGCASDEYSSPKRPAEHSDDSDTMQTIAKAKQSELDELILNLVVEEMLPFRTVESCAFKNLIQSLQPNRSVISKKSLTNSISLRYDEKLSMLKDLLCNTKWVATTVDCWSCHNRSYLGVTVHWIDVETLKRRHAVLVCRCITAHHTYDLLAKELETINISYGIQNKITKMTTDNGSNFLKVFRAFCPEASSESVQASVYAPSRDEASTESDDEADQDEVQFHFVSGVLSCKTELPTLHTLPQHHCCAVHTLNLIATSDAEQALTDDRFKKVSQTTFTKVQTIWNTQSRSIAVADFIQKELNHQLIVPCSTQWKSFYDALVYLHSVVLWNGTALNNICDKVGVSHFSPAEENFMKEYITVMHPVAQALVILQSKSSAYMGLLLPTLTVCLKKLKDLQAENLHFCSTLVKALIAGTESRFETAFKDEDNILAAAFHPRFKLLWIESEEQKQYVKKMMIAKVDEISSETTKFTENNSSNTIQAEMNESLVNNNSSHQVTIFLDSPPSGSRTVYSYCFPSKHCESVFIALNTAIPSSVAVEPTFSMGKNTLRRETFSDANFEKITFLKANKNLF